jgi:hypothetical protein
MAKKFDRPKPTYLASLDEVIITRSGEVAIVKYREENVVTTHYTLGPKIGGMSDQDILDLHNDSIQARGLCALEFRDRPLVEIPLGKPQIEYHKESDQWVPRGDIIRCLVEEDSEEESRLPAIVIDDLELTWEEFGRLLMTHVGWGMRIAFVDGNELHKTRKIEVREPEE